MPASIVEPRFLEFNPGRLCRRRYPRHPKGCPNYGTRDCCPPKAPIWTPETFAGKICYAVWNRFPFGAHVAEMRRRHPEWSQRQVECCLYWQGSARKQLRAIVDAFTRQTSLQYDLVEYIPEAHGIDVTRTMHDIGVELEWPPRTYTYQVALVVYPLTVEERKEA